jgi:hypothetical protein
MGFFFPFFENLEAIVEKSPEGAHAHHGEGVINRIQLVETHDWFVREGKLLIVVPDGF